MTLTPEQKLRLEILRMLVEAGWHERLSDHEVVLIAGRFEAYVNGTPWEYDELDEEEGDDTSE